MNYGEEFCNNPIECVGGQGYPTTAAEYFSENGIYAGQISNLLRGQALKKSPYCCSMNLALLDD
jgi:hypothetical protein